MLDREVRFRRRLPARLDDYRLLFNKIADIQRGQGYANIECSKSDSVEGIMYELGSEDGLRNLDDYEDVSGGHYYRIRVRIIPTIRSAAEAEVLEVARMAISIEAWAYQAPSEKCRPGLRPTRLYLDCLLAARDLLSPGYVRRLEEVETVAEQNT